MNPVMQLSVVTLAILFVASVLVSNNQNTALTDVTPATSSPRVPELPELPDEAELPETPEAPEQPEVTLSSTSDSDINTSIRIKTNVAGSSVVSSESKALDKYKYPGAETLSEDEDSFTQRSGDSPDKATDYYKGLVESFHFPVKNTVKTSTNGYVENKVTAADSSINLEITITKSPGEQTIIDLNLSL